MVVEGNAGMKICAVYTLFLMATDKHTQLIYVTLGD